jgi:two-component system chemotaxis response regulator CheB
MQTHQRKIRVLIVDDSAIFRQLLKEGLTKDPLIEVIATAADPYDARDKIIEHRPDVMTLDVEMPRMDGVNFLQKLMPQYPIPVVMVSSLTQRGKEVTITALSAGAIDFVTKPTATVKDSVSIFITTLVEKVKMAATVDVSRWKGVQKAAPSSARQTPSSDLSLRFKQNIVIAMGASTGGTEALRAIITSLPKQTPGIVVVQHMPPGFTKLYADGLNAQSEMEVVEGETGCDIVTGRVIIAPGGKQMTIRKTAGGGLAVVCEPGEKVNGHAPSVDVLFSSLAAQAAGSVAAAILLTGMGKDGAKGMLELKQLGVHGIAQDEATSVVYGMPRAAVELGAAHEVLALHDIASALIKRSRV